MAPTAEGDARVSDWAPLARLLTAVAARFAVEFDRRLRAAGFANLSLAQSRNLLHRLTAEPQRASTLAADCGVSKQAISQQVAHLQQNGLIRVEADPADARARLLSLTAHGLRAQQQVRRLFHELEAEWASELGEAEYSALRRSLLRLGQGAPDQAC